MLLNRRNFVILAVGFAAGCSSAPGDVNLSSQPTVVNAGPAQDYAVDGVYSRFLSRGFFVVRKDGKLFALSSTCTHRKCRLKAEPDRSFYCKCHGSTFDSNGKVTTGPARRDLPAFPALVNDQGQLLVTVPAS
jgi:Rieske Fe-S protein